MTNSREFLAARRLRELPTSASEIADLLRVVERDLGDARIEALSADRRFATAYNAALQLATIVLRAQGLQTRGVSHHHTTIILLPEFLGDDLVDTSNYLDACRAKRNTVEYDGAGIATDDEVRELIRETEQLESVVVDWLEREHPGLIKK